MTASPSGFVVRNATDADGPRLRDILSSSTEAGGVHWSIEPAADPFATLRAERGGWTAALAEDEVGEILGFVSVATRVVTEDGRPLRTCYVTNLKVLPRHRGRGIGDALCRHAVELSRTAGGDSVPILMVIRAGNEAMQKRVDGPRGFPSLRKFASVQVHAVPVRRAAAIRCDDSVKVTPATHADLDEMAQLWADVADERRFAPALDADGLARWIDGAPGISLADYMVARSSGRVVGWIGWWDEIAVREVRIAGFTRLGAARRAMRDAIGSVRGVTPSPGVGERIGCLRAVHSCIAGTRPDVLRALVVATSRARVRDCSWLKLALDARDPLLAALSDMRSQATPFDARLASPSGKYPPPPPDKPLHLDAALI